MMRTFVLALVLGAALYCGRPPSAPGAVIPLTVADLARDASLIVRGSVAEKTTHWQADGRGRMIVADWSVDVDEVLKGALPHADDRVVQVECEGGTIGATTVFSCEEAGLAPAEDVVLFLVPHPERPGFYRTYGWFQGKYSIVGGMVREALNTPYSEFKRQVVGAARSR